MLTNRSVVRPVAREFARELTSEELALVNGGSGSIAQTGSSTTCDIATVESGSVEHHIGPDDFRGD